MCESDSTNAPLQHSNRCMDMRESSESGGEVVETRHSEVLEPCKPDPQVRVAERDLRALPGTSKSIDSTGEYAGRRISMFRYIRTGAHVKVFMLQSCVTCTSNNEKAARFRVTTMRWRREKQAESRAIKLE